MAHDEKISELTGNDAHHEQPASASAPAQMPDVATLRAMMHERQYAAGKALEQQLEADVLHAREVQEELLFEMIEANKDTPFGRDHGFADIKTVEDFKRTVPFTNYDDYAGYIYEVMERGTRGVVTTEEIVHFNETSGTMGNPKGIPYTKRMAEILMGYSGAYTYYRSYVGAGEGLAGGRMLTLIESHYNTLKSGISFGSLSCKAIADARPYLAATTTSPDEAVFTKPGTDTRYLHARFAIEERDIRDISSVFITGVLDLMRYVEDNWELLVRDIEQGTIDASIQIPVDVRAGLEARIKPNPERAAELRAIFECGFDEPITPAMWPNLLVIRSVAGGGFAPYTQRLRRFIGNDVHILYTGYSASEGAFSVPFELDDPSSVLLQLLMGFTRLDNAPQLGIVAIVGMSVCDVVFNLVAVYVLDLGLRGMGLATALAYCVAVGICCTHFPSKHNTLHLVNPVPHAGQLAGVLKTGLPDSLTRATVMVRTFTFDWLLLTVASAGAVAALSMLSSVNSFASSVTIGVGQTATLLCGIFFGEEDRGALKGTLRTGMRMGLVLSCALCAAVFAFAPQVVGLFGLEGDAEAFGVVVVRAFILCVPIDLINQLFVNYYQGTGNVRAASAIAVGQSGLFAVLFALGTVWFWGATAVWTSFLVGEVVTLALQLVVASVLWRRRVAKGAAAGAAEVAANESAAPAIAGDRDGIAAGGAVVDKATLLDKMMYLPETFQADWRAFASFACAPMSEAVVACSQQVAAWCESHGMDGRRSYLVPLAVEEMAANAVEHGFAKTKHPVVDVKLILKRDGTLVLRMRDNGAAFNPMDLDLSAADPCSAVGIRMLRQGVREVEYQNTVGLNNVVVTLPAASQ